MKSKGTSDYSKRSEAARKAAELEQTISQLERAVAELDQFIEVEELKTRVHDVTDPAYSTFASSVRQRREKLCRSVRRLRLELQIVGAKKPSASVDDSLSAPLAF